MEGKILSSLKSLKKELICIVCTNIFNNPLAITPCGHIFCALCIQQWVDINEKNTCPMCRCDIVKYEVPVKITDLCKTIEHIDPKIVGIFYVPSDNHIQVSKNQNHKIWYKICDPAEALPKKINFKFISLVYGLHVKCTHIEKENNIFILSLEINTFYKLFLVPPSIPLIEILIFRE